MTREEAINEGGIWRPDRGLKSMLEICAALRENPPLEKGGLKDAAQGSPENGPAETERFS